MKVYKKQLLAALVKQGWSLNNIASDDHWWLEEQWSLNSVKDNFGFELFLSFVTDPMWEGAESDAPVAQIVLSKERPRERSFDDMALAILDMNRGFFEEQLSLFIEQMHFSRIVNEGRQCS